MSPDPTRSNSLRAARDELVATRSLRGPAFGRALSNLIDHALVDATAGFGSRAAWALVALGSYARRELCPGSDVDVMLLHSGGRRASALRDDASRLWYPLWDAGFVLGHSTRSVKEALALADTELDALTALLDTRLLVGDDALLDETMDKVRRLAPKRRNRLIDDLASGAAARLEQPGPIAEMLEPNLKDGGGGLRDIQAPGWIGWALGPDPGGPGATPGSGGWSTGVATLVALGYLRDEDRTRLRETRDLLLDARVALHRVTGGRSDLLTLQDQDAVARMVGATDADAHVRELGEAARAVVWITSDVWSRLLATRRGPGGRSSGVRVLGNGIVVRDDRVALEQGVEVDTLRVLTLAAHAAQLQLPIDRDTLVQIAELRAVEWTSEVRDAFIALLAAGRGAIPVVEALDHVGVLVRLLPQWEHVRARPQRNAYHRFTVDRHSLEAVAECAVIRQADDFDGDVARRARTDLLLLSALMHDIGKGHPRDHSEVGAETAAAVCRRIGLDEHGTGVIVWLVRNHLLLADMATRRDLSDELTITRFARAVGNAERLDLLYTLTIGDSRATGPAAWSTSKAALVRELFVKTDLLFEEGVVGSETAALRRAELAALIGPAADEYLDAMPPAYTTAFSAEVLARHRDLIARRELAVEWDEVDGRLRCTVVALDRTGLLATVAASLSLVGFDIGAATGYTHHDGMALEVFAGTDRFERLTDPAERERLTTTLEGAMSGEFPVEERLRERTRRYRATAAPASARDVRIIVDMEASSFATVVEVHAPDDVGLLARVAAVFADLGLDVSQAIVSTLGDRVVDVFYLRDETRQKLTDRLAIDSLRATLLARLTTEVTLS
ncbi:MAG: [protein-PII] uridylyltransferase [Acidimicrobiia bacterium]